MTESSAEFKARLIRRTGLSSDAVTAAWPEWWSVEAEGSPSAAAELRFSIARKLGLDPRSLISENEPRFIWNDSARFKNLKEGAPGERPIISSFGTALTRLLLQGVPGAPNTEAIHATDLRNAILATSQSVGLIELLSTCWGLGIPVIHLRVYPLSAKRMSAMSVRVGDRYAILLARDAQYPAPIAFYLAHEMGHILLGHLEDGCSIVDMEMLEDLGTAEDSEEMQADAFALELLTGRAQPELVVQGEGRGAQQLAREAARVGQIERIEPGTLALAFGYAAKAWPTAIAALQHIYGRPLDVSGVVNTIASGQLAWRDFPDESESFVRAVMGLPHG
ncbi:ImmA/IrrE family metallo-endopeptidase [Noviluteimonas gilva]|uniref:ImmA/IrrE family metallo-endopeptidase n=1 Tax=Noviluteimonas gilva TaxID=2682097 RepID=A0A7C9HMJ3_9GAMM|nr:ImmA/IrrE family metallo-endopeptidase [Lysobacter gilvus]MUV14575.1 ImmA/IrrE family metallo-endopeptidase [Lysobacter gilvus]